MSLYNLLFGRNAQTPLLLAVIGFKECDVERLRDVTASDDGATISVYTRTGGGNREDYPQEALHASPLFRETYDDDGDSTYATFEFAVPPEFVADVKALRDPLAHGVRPEFGQHLLKTLNREPTEADKATAAHEAERAAVARTKHLMANGHTFVPLDDWAMREALKLAEANGGKLRSCWGIMPLKIDVAVDKAPWPGMKSPEARYIERVKVGYDLRWAIDEAYWRHCKELFAADYPLTMAKIGEAVEQRLGRAA